jgi:hypothetical protein
MARDAWQTDTLARRLAAVDDASLPAVMAARRSAMRLALDLGDLVAGPRGQGRFDPRCEELFHAAAAVLAGDDARRAALDRFAPLLGDGEADAWTEAWLWWLRVGGSPGAGHGVLWTSPTASVRVRLARPDPELTELQTFVDATRPPRLGGVLWDPSPAPDVLVALAPEPLAPGVLRTLVPPGRPSWDRGPALSAATALDAVDAVGRAVAALHAHDRRAGPIEPGLVWWTDRGPLLHQPGLAAAAYAHDRKDRSVREVPRSSPMAPEAVRDRHEAATDVFYLAWWLFELLNGEAPYGPFHGLQALEDLMAGRRRPFAPDTDPAVADVLARALRPDPAERFATVDAFRAALVAARRPVWALCHEGGALLFDDWLGTGHDTPMFARDRARLDDVAARRSPLTRVAPVPVDTVCRSVWRAFRDRYFAPAPWFVLDGEPVPVAPEGVEVLHALRDRGPEMARVAEGCAALWGRPWFMLAERATRRLSAGFEPTFDDRDAGRRLRGEHV